MLSSIITLVIRILKMATIRQIIAEHYNELLGQCTSDKVISQGRTEFDILQDICITAIRKFKESEIEEEEGYSYLKKTLFTEKHFQRKRLKNEIIIYMGDLNELGV